MNTLTLRLRGALGVLVLLAASACNNPHVASNVPPPVASGPVQVGPNQTRRPSADEIKQRQEDALKVEADRTNLQRIGATPNCVIYRLRVDGVVYHVAEGLRLSRAVYPAVSCSLVVH